MFSGKRLFGLLSLLWLLAAGRAFAQELDINGYSTVVIPYEDTAIYGVVGGIKRAAAAAGFEVLDRTDRERTFVPARTLLLAVIWDAPSARGTIEVRAFDLATRKQVAVAQRPLDRDCFFGARASMRRVRQCSSELIAGLRYGGFDPQAHRRNLDLLSRPPAESLDASVEPGAPGQ